MCKKSKNGKMSKNLKYEKIRKMLENQKTWKIEKVNKNEIHRFEAPHQWAAAKPCWRTLCSYGFYV